MFSTNNPWHLTKVLDMPQRCSECGQPFELEPGFYYGTGYVSYALSVLYLIITQIKSLRIRIRLIRSMQAFGVLSFLFCVICMYTIFRGWTDASFIVFGISICCFIVSLVTSLVEITLSMRALEVELSDIEELSKSNFFKDMIGKE